MKKNLNDLTREDIRLIIALLDERARLQEELNNLSIPKIAEKFDAKEWVIKKIAYEGVA